MRCCHESFVYSRAQHIRQCLECEFSARASCELLLNSSSEFTISAIVCRCVIVHFFSNCLCKQSLIFDISWIFYTWIILLLLPSLLTLMMLSDTGTMPLKVFIVFVLIQGFGVNHCFCYLFVNYVLVRETSCLFGGSFSH